MANTWIFRQGLFVSDRIVTGYHVQARDGSVGKVRKATEEIGRSHLLVKAGFWVFGKKRIIPAGVVARIDDQSKTVYVKMSKHQIKRGPQWEQNWMTDTTYPRLYGPYSWK